MTIQTGEEENIKEAGEGKDKEVRPTGAGDKRDRGRGEEVTRGERRHKSRSTNQEKNIKGRNRGNEGP